MNVLHFCMSRGWGGLEMASFQWARIFNEQGHQSHSICYTDTPLAEKLRSSELIFKEMTFRPYFSPAESWKLRQYVVKNKIEVVFLQSLKDLWSVVPALMGTHCKLVGFAQMWLQGVDKKDPLHTWLYNRMDMLVTLTPKQGEQVLRCLPVDPKKAKVLPNSIKSERFSPHLRSADIRKTFGANENETLVGIVGRLDPQKGQRELIEAFASAVKKAPELPLKLVLIGDLTPDAGESYLDSLKTEISKHKLESKVKLIGFRSDIPEVMASLDIFVLNSYQEAFGFVLVEAMASGTAVIATNSGGVPDILHNGKYGALVPPKDVEALSEQILKLARNKEARLKQAQIARDYTLQEFDEMQTFKKLITYLEKL